VKENRGTASFEDTSMLPIAVLYDELIGGKRIVRLKINDVFEPNRKILPRVMGGVVFTKYHFHDGIEILRIVKGRATAVINNRAYKVSEGDVLIVNPYEAHGIFLETLTDDFARSCVIFKPQDIFPSGKGISVFDRLRMLRFENYIAAGEGRDAILESVDKIVEIAKHSGRAGAVDEIGALIGFYSSAISCAAVSDAEEIAPYRRDFVTRVTDKVAEMLPKDISTEYVASYSGYSTEHFCRLFKQCFGETFKSYVTSCRIKLAKDMIDAGGSHSVAELARMTGFVSTNHFTSMFVRHVGMTPTEYMKKRKRVNET